MLFDCLLRRDRAALGRVLLSGVLFGLVAVTVYLPGVLSASVTSRTEAFGFGGKFTTDPLTLLASILPTTAVPGTTSDLTPSRLPRLVPPGRGVDRLASGEP